MHIVTPSFLIPGDTIGIASTARWVSPEQLQPALDLFHSWGLKTVVGKHTHEKHFQLAGNDQQRTADLQTMLDNPQIKAIIIARGGYGTVRVIDQLDFTKFLEAPKWICGYSDITVLHAHINGLFNVATIHSTMPISFPHATEIALENLKHALFGALSTISLEEKTNAPDQKRVGRIFGGNLSVLYSLIASDSLELSKADFLFIEDVDEMTYHIDRMMMAMLRAGLLQNLKAIIVGGMTQMKDNTKEFGFELDNPWGMTVREVIEDVASKADIPVFFGFPAGHQNDNRAFYLGNNVELICNEGTVSMDFKHA